MAADLAGRLAARIEATSTSWVMRGADKFAVYKAASVAPAGAGAPVVAWLRQHRAPVTVYRAP